MTDWIADGESGESVRAKLNSIPNNGSVADVATTAQGVKADSAVQPGALATVATSGAYSDLTGLPTLGTAAALDVGVSASEVVQLDGSARLPAVDGSQLTGLSGIQAIDINYKLVAGAISSTGAQQIIATEPAAGGAGYIYSSFDGGKSWVKNSDAGAKAWRALTSSSDGQNLVACVYGGHVYVSTDAGSTWTQTSAGSQSWVAASSSDDGQSLCVFEENGLIKTSADAGSNWTTRTATDFVGGEGEVASSSDGQKLAIAGFGFVYTSTNGGASWSQHTASGNRDWRAIASSGDGSVLLAAIGSGGVYLSADSGATWNVQADAGSRSWRGVAVSDDGQNLIAVELSGHIAQSNDGGVTWAQPGLINPIADLSFVCCSDDGAVLLTGGSTSYYVFVSNDTGASWKFYRTTVEIFSGPRHAVVNGGAAGDIVVTGIANGDILDEVTEYVFTAGAVTDIVDVTDQFIISNDNQISNDAARGINTTGNKLMVRWTRLS